MELSVSNHPHPSPPRISDISQILLELQKDFMCVTKLVQHSFPVTKHLMYFDTSTFHVKIIDN